VTTNNEAAEVVTEGREPPPPSKRAGIDFIPPEIVAQILSCSVAMLERWRRDLPGGPPWYRFGPRMPRYLRSEIEEWATSKRIEGPRMFVDNEPEEQST